MCFLITLSQQVGGLSKGTVVSASTSVSEKPAPPALALMPDSSVLVCAWSLSRCSPSAAALKECVQVSLCTGPLRGLPGTPEALCFT